MNAVQSQVKVVAWLHILLGVLSLVGGILFALFFGAIAALFAGAATGSASAGALGFIGVGGIVFIFIGVFAIPHLVVAWGLLNGAEWARIAGIILSILSLFHPVLGLGTAIAIYSLIILFSSETSDLFRRSA